MGKIRVLLVEDSLTIRKFLADTLRAAPEMELIGEAADGKHAIELCRDLRPDVIAMDMMLPVMTGLSATEYIMAYCPTPILIVSASVNRGELFKTYDALAAGAVDVLEKPTGREPDGVWEMRFLAALRQVSKIRVINHPRAKLAVLNQSSAVSSPGAAPVIVRNTPPPTALPPTVYPHHHYELLAIGASTGGPGAIVEILHHLPAHVRWPILFVLHLKEPFGTVFADWLDAQTTRRVAYPQDGDLVKSATGRVIMAPGDQHMIVRDGRIRLTNDPELHSCRPSVDTLFDSVARSYGKAAIGCLLTGMGRDGAAGLLEMRKAGGFTIAQDEASSIVYGMPREAQLLNAATRILPLKEIAPSLAAIASANRSAAP